MAKERVTHTCGHSEIHAFFGSSSDRKRKAAWYETTLCSDCYAAEQRALREAANAQAATENREADLPPLTGTEKQIPWAEGIRADAIKSMLGRLSFVAQRALRYDPNFDARLAALRSRGEVTPEMRADLESLLTTLIYEWAATQLTSRFWIDHRDDIETRFAKANAGRLWAATEAIVCGQNPLEVQARQEAERQAVRAAEAAEKAASAAVRESARKEATVISSEAKTSLVADIVVVETMVKLHYPEYNEAVLAVARRLNFDWKDGHFERHSPTPDGSVVELGHRLLAAGINIRLYDAELRRRAIAGEYTPEPMRVVRRCVSGPHAGNFAIYWSRADDFFDALKRIKGSKWVKPCMYVPAAKYAEVQDFAALNGFSFSDAGLALVAEQKELRRASVTVPTPAVDIVARPVSATPPQLAVPDVVEVAPSLMEDEDDAP